MKAMKLKHLIHAFLLAIIFFGGCTRNDMDNVSKRNCRPKFATDPAGNPFAEFIYTDWGAPKFITRTETGTGAYEYAFYYNEQKQMIGLREGIFNDTDTGTNVYWSYVYDGSRIIADTLFSGASLEDPVNEDYYLDKYLYDSIGRVIERSTLNSRNSNYKDTILFAYPSENPFENNHSILAGIEELMFVNLDYNLENPGVTSKNADGYPTGFSEWLNGVRVNGYRFKTLEIQNITYECPN